MKFERQVFEEQIEKHQRKPQGRKYRDFSYFNRNFCGQRVS
jgi:hypothetical protein